MGILCVLFTVIGIWRVRANEDLFNLYGEADLMQRFKKKTTIRINNAIVQINYLIISQMGQEMLEDPD